MGAQNNKGWIALMLAAQNGHEQVARVLLEAGAVVIAQTNDGTTALMLAAHNGHEQVARVLLEAGADRNPNSTRGVICCALMREKRNHRIPHSPGPGQ